jgi:hypothetical protein
MWEPLYRQTFDASTLLEQYPPRFQHSHKQALFHLAYPDGRALPNQIEVTCWPETVPDAVVIEVPLKLEARLGYFDYQPVGFAAIDWHVNFADPHLFCAYGSQLFAQDEMQVAEHPLLGSIREGLVANGIKPMTCDRVQATPVLVRNVERRLEVATNPDPKAGRPNGLYGNLFAAAPWDAVRQATRIIDPPTITNFIAMAAPGYGRGEYSRDDLLRVFATTFTAFSAANQVSVSNAGVHQPTAIHTGFWGCGAFGGNRQLMVALQIIAAKAAKIDHLIFHVGARDGMPDAQRGIDTAEILESRCGPACSLDDLLRQFMEFGFKWGVSDGN